MRRLAIFSGAFALGTAACVWLLPSLLVLCGGILAIVGFALLRKAKEKVRLLPALNIEPEQLDKALDLLLEACK